tara:strand:+ start:23 stop:535 length:513 start_codon:yes stop_codon:yes gene_type:complete
MFRFLPIFILIIISCSLQETESALLNKKNPDGYYGNKIILKEYSSFEDLMSSPDQYLDKDVLISGEIVEVCPMRGCWINVKDNNSDIIIRVKVTDGMIVFPLSSKGKQVDAQGKFLKLNFTEEQAKNWKIHLAEEQGVILNPDDVILEPSDLVEYRVVGKGAQIYSHGCK